VRGIVGALFLILVLLLAKKRPSFAAIKRNLVVLLLSGVAIGANWILLFESYSYTTIATSTLCYYMAPVILILLSAIFLKERVTPKKCISIVLAVIGMVFVSGVIGGEIPKGRELIGILLGLGAACFYASVTLLNKKMKDISPFDMTVVQLLAAAIVVVPYTVFAESITRESFNLKVIILLLCVGIIHTGIAYTMYFNAVKHLEAAKVAIFAYIDPIVALVLSVTVLKEPFSPFFILGAALILISAALTDVDFGRLLAKNKK
jgi:RarD protein